MRVGDNVDVVANAHSLPFDEEFDCVVCLETLEHDDNPFMTIDEAHRVLKIGGYLIVCSPSINFPRHNYPSDYFRFTADGLCAVMNKFKILKAFDDENEAYAVAIKI